MLCSVDASAASTFKAIKGIDLFEHVWDNLGAYADLGCEVAIKYLMTSENTGAEEIEQFVIRAGQLRGAHVIGDVSHYDPNPAPAIIAACISCGCLRPRQGAVSSWRRRRPLRDG